MSKVGSNALKNQSSQPVKKPARPTLGLPKLSLGTSAVESSKESDSRMSKIREVISDPQFSGQGSLHFYKLGQQIGQGSFGKVYRGWHRISGQELAIKVYPLSALQHSHFRHSVQKETDLLKSLMHPGVIALYEVIQEKTSLYIMTEYASGGSLKGLLRRKKGGGEYTEGALNESEAKVLFQQVVAAVAYLHHDNIMHRDLKLENVLLDKSGFCKILDLGFSTVIKPGGRLKDRCGTVVYMAPELIEVGKNGYSISVDVWAMGVMLYIMLTGNFPFRPTSIYDMKKNMRKEDLKYPTNISPAAKELVYNMLRFKEEDRPTAHQVLSHVWFTQKSEPVQQRIVRHLSLDERTQKLLQDQAENRKRILRHKSFGSGCPTNQAANEVNDAQVASKSRSHLRPRVPLTRPKSANAQFGRSKKDQQQKHKALQMKSTDSKGQNKEPLTAPPTKESVLSSGAFPCSRPLPEGSPEGARPLTRHLSMLQQKDNQSNPRARGRSYSLSLPDPIDAGMNPFPPPSPQPFQCQGGKETQTRPVSAVKKQEPPVPGLPVPPEQEKSSDSQSSQNLQTHWPKRATEQHRTLQVPLQQNDDESVESYPANPFTSSSALSEQSDCHSEDYFLPYSKCTTGCSVHVAASQLPYWNHSASIVSTSQPNNSLDLKVVEYMGKLGFSLEAVRSALCQGAKNQLTTCYFLLWESFAAQSQQEMSGPI